MMPYSLLLRMGNVLLILGFEELMLIVWVQCWDLELATILGTIGKRFLGRQHVGLLVIEMVQMRVVHNKEGYWFVDFGFNSYPSSG
jgi:hypothetical protein